jgi:hypothetical protein
VPCAVTFHDLYIQTPATQAGHVFESLRALVLVRRIAIIGVALVRPHHRARSGTVACVQVSNTEKSSKLSTLHVQAIAVLSIRQEVAG